MNIKLTAQLILIRSQYLNIHTSLIRFQERTVEWQRTFLGGGLQGLLCVLCFPATDMHNAHFLSVILTTNWSP